MKASKTLCTAMSSIIFLGVGQAKVAAFTINQLTNNNFVNFYPDISGSNVVWGVNDYEEEDGTTFADVFLYDGTTTTQLTGNGEFDDEYSPQVSGSNVVWTGYDGNDSEIFFYDGTTTTQLTNNSDDEFPEVSGSNVVWSSTDGNDSEIFLYDGTTTTQLTNNSLDDEFARISISGSNVVWEDYVSAGSSNLVKLYLYDGKTTTQLADIPSYESGISGSNVVWSGFDGNEDLEIFLYDGKTTTQLTNNSFSDYMPAISGKSVVWLGGDGGSVQIFTTTVPEPSSALGTLAAGACGAGWMLKRKLKRIAKSS